MSILDVLFGKPLASSEDQKEKLGSAAGIPIFGLDGLSSAAYGPEAALTLLIPLGAAGIAYILPIIGCITALLLILYFSYRQTIEAYPSGGGSYTVARENLGPFPGLLAAASLMVDYTLTVAVGISAGVGALVSAVPRLQPHLLALCLGILVLLMVLNLRGMREAGAIFMIPTYLFVACLLTTLGAGIVRALMSAGPPPPVVAPPQMPAAAAAAGAWLLLKAFASGCTAMTGVEAVSNGVTSFREPVVKNAQRALTVIIAILVVLLGGIAYLCKAYQIGAMDPVQAGYQSVLSQLVAAVGGQGVFYYVTMGSVLLVLALSANTAFAGFPQLCRTIAQDGYLPRSFGSRGRRLVYSEGIYVVGALSGALLILFGGVTDRLIPLFAIGALLAFTFSQLGMVRHWRRVGNRPGSMLVNGLGALATAVTVVIVLVAKFVEGAWVIVILIPALVWLMMTIRKHYEVVDQQTASAAPLDLSNFTRPIAVIPVLKWGKIAQEALRFALELSDDVRVLHISSEDTDQLSSIWTPYVEAPAKSAGLKTPELVIIRSPYRFVVTPIVNYVLELERSNSNRQIAVIVPELVERHWYHYFLHNQRAAWLKAVLLLRGCQRIIVINVPWYLGDV